MRTLAAAACAVIVSLVVAGCTGSQSAPSAPSSAIASSASLEASAPGGAAKPAPGGHTVTLDLDPVGCNAILTLTWDREVIEAWSAIFYRHPGNDVTNTSYNSQQIVHNLGSRSGTDTISWHLATPNRTDTLGPNYDVNAQGGIRFKKGSGEVINIWAGLAGPNPDTNGTFKCN